MFVAAVGAGGSADRNRGAAQVATVVEARVRANRARD
jgi:hypothetical protein